MRARIPLRKAAAGTIIAFIAVVVLAADQFSKQSAIEALTGKGNVHILGDALIFRLVYNPGAAFSLGEGVTWIFTIALALVAGFVVFLMFTRVHSRLWAVTLGMLLGGVLGNLTDRLFRDPGFPVGHVVDFIFTPWMMQAIYNIADIFIVSSMIAVALLVLFGLRLDGTREVSAKQKKAMAEAEADTAAPADADSELEAPETGGTSEEADAEREDVPSSRRARREATTPDEGSA